MFSYFKNGIIDTTPDKTIDLPELIKIIRNNPERILIEYIRLLRKEGNEEYQELKEKLPYLTPNCMVKYRSLKKDDDFNKNFIASSRYIYFDTDDIINVDEYKEYFIKKYGHLVSMVSKSSSCGGLSILFKLTNNINSKEQFFDVWDNIRTTILQDETIDAKCKDIGRAMFISYDPEVYVNYDNEITVEVTDTINNKKRLNHPISYNNINNRLDYSFSDKKKEDYSYAVIPIDIVLTKLIMKTRVLVDNPVVDFKPIEYAKYSFLR